MAVNYDNLAAKAPVIVEGSRKARQAQAGRAQQQAIAAAPTGDISRQAQQLGAATAAARGAADEAAMQEGQQLQQQLGAQALRGQAMEQERELGQLERGQAMTMQEEDIAARERQQEADIAQRKQLTSRDLAERERLSSLGLSYDERLSFMNRQQKEDLAALGRDTRQKLFDQRMAFEEGELGRKFANMRQLADWSISSAQNQQQLQQRMQNMKQSYEKDMMLAKFAHSRITQELDQEFKKAEQERNQVHMKQLAEAKAAMEEEMQKKQAMANNMSTLFSAAGMAVGAFFGGPAGAAAGAAAGGLVGGAVAQEMA